MKGKHATEEERRIALAADELLGDCQHDRMGARMRYLTIAEIRFTEALITEAEETAAEIASVRELGDDAEVVQQLRATASWLRGVRDTCVLVSG